MLKRLTKTVLPDIALDWLVLIRRHWAIHGEFPRIFRPRTFNEKILRRTLLDRRPVFHLIADKFAVRSYVAERLGSEFLTTIYHVTADPRSIPFDDLPQKFVVKPTHGSGMVQLVRDKSRCDREALIAKCKYWLRRDYYERTREIPYRGIPPRIVVEELLENADGSVPLDYKLFVFDGKVQMIQVIAERFTVVRKGYLGRSGEELDICYGSGAKFDGGVPKPRDMQKLIAAAELLGCEFDFIRVDFYALEDRIYFGELTATPSGGRARFQPTEYDGYLGHFWRPKRRLFVL